MIDQKEKYTVYTNMITYGGSFVTQLGKSLALADQNNTRRIKESFPDYWDKYLNIENKKVNKDG